MTILIGHKIYDRENPTRRGMVIGGGEYVYVILTADGRRSAIWRCNARLTNNEGRKGTR